MSAPPGSARALAPRPADVACLRCGDCCRWPGHVLLAPADLGRLAAVLGLGQDEVAGRYTVLAPNRAQLALRSLPDGSCVFLDGGACAVYAGRPAQCRAFPSGWSVSGCRAIESAAAAGRGRIPLEMGDAKSR